MIDFNSFCCALVAILSSWTLHISWLICVTVGNFCVKKSSVFSMRNLHTNLEFLPLATFFSKSSHSPQVAVDMAAVAGSSGFD